jgi:hypothetical protein
MKNTTNETPKQYQCRHIFTDGRRCSSPCLRHEEFCYYHHTTRKPVENPRQRRSRRSSFHLPLPEDRSAIQSSIGQVLQRIASNDIDPRRAGLLLYGLQIASLNLPKLQTAAKDEPETQTVKEITIDPELGTLAPRTEIPNEEERLSTIGALLRKFERHAAEPASEPTAAILPTLQAAEDFATPSIKRKRHPSPERSRTGRSRHYREQRQWRVPSSKSPRRGQLIKIHIQQQNIHPRLPQKPKLTPLRVFEHQPANGIFRQVPLPGNTSHLKLRSSGSDIRIEPRCRRRHQIDRNINTRMINLQRSHIPSHPVDQLLVRRSIV